MQSFWEAFSGKTFVCCVWSSHTRRRLLLCQCQTFKITFIPSQFPNPALMPSGFLICECPTLSETNYHLIFSYHHPCPLLNLIYVHLRDIMGSLCPPVRNQPIHAVINWRIPKNILKTRNLCLTIYGIHGASRVD